MVRVLSIPGSYSPNRFFGLLIGELDKVGVTTITLRDRDARRFQFDILHLHFPTHYVTQYDPLRALAWCVAFGSFFAAARLLGKRVVYTVHDVEPLEPRNRWLLGPFVRFVHAITDAFVFLSRSSRCSFAARFPAAARKPWALTLHGPYPSVRLSPSERDAVRAGTVGGDPPLLIGCLGAIKPYKHFETVAALPQATGDGTPAHLLMAGYVEPDYQDRVEAALRAWPPERLTRIGYKLGEVELDNLIQAVDFSFLPYARGSNSGFALLVLGNRGRIIASDLPVFAELQAALGRPWIYTFAAGDGAALTAAFAAATRDVVTQADEVRLRAYLDGASFARAAATLRSLYDGLLRRRS